jgi:hypothetical protein
MIPMTRVIPPNMKKTADDPKLALMIGRMMRENEHPSQFRTVAKGTTLAGIISGTYIQTTGPIVVLKIVI